MLGRAAAVLAGAGGQAAAGVPAGGSIRRAAPRLARAALAGGIGLAVVGGVAAVAEPAQAAVDPGTALRAVALSSGDPRPLVQAAILENACRLLPDTRAAEPVPHLKTALASYAATGAGRDAARVRSLLRTRGGARRLEDPSGLSAMLRPAIWCAVTSRRSSGRHRDGTAAHR